MTTEIDAIRTAILEGAPAEEIGGAAAARRPCAARSVKADEQEMFEGIASEDKDPRKSTHVEEFPLPELAPDEAYVAVMASAINFNTVWTSIFEPLPDVRVPEAPRHARSMWGARHDQPYHVMGSDAAGVVLQVGSAVRNWKPGDEVTAHCLHVDDQDPSAHDDSMMATNQRIWGFETNFGGLAEIAVVKANQLMPKPKHLTWEEAACNALCNSTSYRMIVSPNGSQMTQGQAVLVWGATGGIGAYATQYVLTVAARRSVSCRREKRAAAAARAGLRSSHRPARRGLQVLEATRTSRTRRNGCGSARRSVSSSGATSTSCSSTPAVRRWAPRCSSRSAAG